MRQYSPATARQAPTDRNPTKVQNGSTGNAIAGGASVTLTDYTVPAGRVAQVTLDVSAVVTVVLAAAQFLSCAVQITTFIHARRTGPAAAAGTTIQLGAFTYFLKAGDRIIVSASENAGAGTSEASGGIEGVEYDA